MQNFYLPLVGRLGGGGGRRGLDTTNLRFHMTRVSERSLKAFVVSSFLLSQYFKSCIFYLQAQSFQRLNKEKTCDEKNLFIHLEGDYS